MTTLLLAMSLLTTPQSPAAMSANAVAVTPKTIAEFEMSELKGVIRKLAWNPDGTTLYLETAELDQQAQPKTVHGYLIDAGSGKLSKAKDVPAWATAYWEWKSWKSAPGDDDFLIDLSTEERKRSAVGIPMAGDYARGGSGGDPNTGVTMDAAMAAVQQSQFGTVHMMKLKGQTIGEWINLPIVPGQSFGWGPKGTNVIAYAEVNNRQLMLMDKSGTKTKIDDTRGVFSPSWSDDGRRLAWVEVRGKKATVKVATVEHK
jgi:hypothetical protein